jgi:hypothetical protein
MALAEQVEHWFGLMTGEPGFHAALAKHISRGTALVATADPDSDPLGALLFSAKPPFTTSAGLSWPSTHAGLASAVR